ncbi:MAG: hypothetical protein GX276_02975, partial [Clostridiaceae bacterium]|nr:hypothetical protein [Clostridiaceae bacterium]
MANPKKQFQKPKFSPRPSNLPNRPGFSRVRMSLPGKPNPGPGVRKAALATCPKVSEHPVKGAALHRALKMTVLRAHGSRPVAAQAL